jgi:hypothetical protein
LLDGETRVTGRLINGNPRNLSITAAMGFLRDKYSRCLCDQRSYLLDGHGDRWSEFRTGRISEQAGAELAADGIERFPIQIDAGDDEATLADPRLKNEREFAIGHPIIDHLDDRM